MSHYCGMPRAFRTNESVEAENRTREEVVPFLGECRFTEIREDRKRRGSSVEQTVRACDENGTPVVMGVRLCWRKRYGQSDEGYSAFQMLFKVKEGGPRNSIQKKLDREIRKGKTHWLAINRDENGIRHAILFPIGEVLQIWTRQCEIYDRLINEKKLGIRMTNPALNGDSPAFYIQDERAQDAVSFIFTHPKVRILVPMSAGQEASNDTFDDLPPVDSSLLGSDGAPRIPRIVSGVKRDPAVRRAVILRAQGKCERCGTHRSFSGFFDVHHIFGAEKGDRVWNCVAVCPNCHREAHFSPELETINAALLKVAAGDSHAPTS